MAVMVHPGAAGPLPWSFRICGKSEAASLATAMGATRVVSLLDPDDGLQTPADLNREDHLSLPMLDVDDPSLRHAPAPAQVAHLLDWGRGIRAGDRVLIHCFGGISRSPAAALALVAQALGPGRDDDAMTLVRKIRPTAVPNRLIVGAADAALGRRGDLLAALDARRFRLLDLNDGADMDILS